MNCILGTANGYGLAEIELFVKSVRKSNSSVDIVLFAQDFSPEVVGFANRAEVRLNQAFFGMRRGARLLRGRFRCLHRPLWVSLAGSSSRAWLLRRTTAVMVRRFAHYARFLARDGSQYRWIFLSDVRDVLWQGDLFECIQEPGLHAFIEDESVVIGSAGDNNINWLQRLLGIQDALPLCGNVSSCAGTIFGDFQSIRDYLALFLQLAGHYDAHNNCEDQAIHNIIVHKHLLPKIIQHHNISGPVFTMCNVSPNEVEMDARGFVVGRSGEPYAVLHHYDRHRPVLQAAQARFDIPLSFAQGN